jgi:secreted protein with Ig-like and vWFA domain
MSEKHLDVGHVVVFGYEDNRLIREAARAAGVGAIEFIRRSALAAAAPRPAEETR